MLQHIVPAKHEATNRALPALWLQQPGTPHPPGNPDPEPVPNDPEVPVPIEEPPKPLPEPPVDVPVPPVKGASFLQLRSIA
jgi:hypothetical protein